ncbi:MAG: hypothetical protein AAGA99_07385 [Actinomycetota bacterium]
MRAGGRRSAVGPVGVFVLVIVGALGSFDAAAAEESGPCAAKVGLDRSADLPPIPHELGFPADGAFFERLGVRPDDLARALPLDLLEVATAPVAPDALVSAVEPEEVVAGLNGAEIVAAAERMGQLRSPDELLDALGVEPVDVVAGVSPDRIAEILDVDVATLTMDADGDVAVDEIDEAQMAKIVDSLSQTELGWAAHRGRRGDAPTASSVLTRLGIESGDRVIIEYLPAAEIVGALRLENRQVIELLGASPMAVELRLVDEISADELVTGLGQLPADVSDLMGRSNAEILDLLGGVTSDLLDGLPIDVVLRVLLSGSNDEDEREMEAVEERFADVDVDAIAHRLFNEETLVQLLGANVVVRADLQLVDVASLSASEHRFDVVADFAAVWCDPRRLDSVVEIVDESASWLPTIRIADAVGPRETLDWDVTDDGSGTVRYEERFRVEVVWTGNIRMFPLDRHSIELRVVPERNQILVRDADLIRIEHDLAAGRSPNDWRWNTDSLTLESVVGGDLVVTSTVTRRPIGYAINVLLPMVLIVTVSWSVFLMSPKAQHERTTILVTMFLALVAFDFVSNEVVPAVPYTTLLDGAVLTSYSFLLVALLATAANNALVGVEAHTARPVALRRMLGSRGLHRWFRRWFLPAYATALAAVAVGFLVVT